MPRVTRAALRSTAALEADAHLAAATPLPSTPTRRRTPFGEITGNVGEAEPDTAPNDAAAAKPTLKVKLKVKQTRAAKKGGKKVDAEREKAEVLEDDHQSGTSSAVEEACDDLLNEGSGASALRQSPIHDSRPRTPPSKAVQATRQHLNSQRSTPCSDPDDFSAKELSMRKSADDDSFVGVIASRSPAKMTHGEDVEGAAADHEPILGNVNAMEDDSFAEKILARTPLKPSLRIEDSVEAIDALEEAIATIGESLPTLNEVPPSPVKSSHSSSKKVLRQTSTANSATPRNNAHLPAKSPMAKRTTAGRAVKAKAASKPTGTTTKPSTQPRSNKVPPSTTKHNPPPPSRISPTTSTPKPTTKSPTNPIPKRSSRISSISKAPFEPHKSTKALTRPTFTLPGEAISQKLKAAREERLQREEQALSQKRSFKAKPVRVSIAPALGVKDTLLSRARRMSVASGNPEPPSVGKDTNTAAIKPVRVSSLVSGRTRPSGRPSVVNTTTTTIPRVASRATAASSTKPPTSSSSPPRASLSTRSPPPTTGSKSSGVPAVPRVSLSAGARVAGKGSKAAALRGKEVFNRDRVEKDTRERERKEKEEAAKRARAEAAERGRVASREWAERARVKREREKVNAAAAVAVVGAV